MRVIEPTGDVLCVFVVKRWENRGANALTDVQVVGWMTMTRGGKEES
jgi:hypothetical protein